jgi:hypothetical protein
MFHVEHFAFEHQMRLDFFIVPITILLVQGKIQA